MEAPKVDDRRKTVGRLLSGLAAVFAVLGARAEGAAITFPLASSGGVAFSELALRCAPNVALGTMAAIARHESSVNPYAIGINDKHVRLERQPENAAEAVATATKLMALGFNFDVGLGQVNSGNLKRMGLGFSEVFDPCGNLRAAASILTDCYSRAAASKGPGQLALRAALSCYNTNSLTSGFANGYVGKVVAQATPLGQVPEIVPLKNGEALPIPLELRSGTSATPTPKADATPEAPGKPTPPRGSRDDNEPDIFSQPDTMEEDASDSTHEGTTTPGRPVQGQATAGGG